MIRFLIHTTSSLTDINGNRYHFATVTSTKTGKSLHIKNLGGPSNGPHYVRKLTDADWREIISTSNDEKIRRFNELRKFHANDGALYEHELTAEHFKELETAEDARPPSMHVDMRTGRRESR